MHISVAAVNLLFYNNFVLPLNNLDKLRDNFCRVTPKFPSPNTSSLFIPLLFLLGLHNSQQLSLPSSSFKMAFSTYPHFPPYKTKSSFLKI